MLHRGKDYAQACGKTITPFKNNLFFIHRNEVLWVYGRLNKQDLKKGGNISGDTPYDPSLSVMLDKHEQMWVNHRGLDWLATCK